ncbi:MAG: hypothetical protein JKP95_01340 [Oceanicaulis sp.]|nr:hypothetical protein [Oceanicaulis sp.]
MRRLVWVIALIAALFVAAGSMSASRPGAGSICRPAPDSPPSRPVR